MTICDVDFSGDSYETTQFDQNTQILSSNIHITESFLSSLGSAIKSESIESAYTWYDVPSKNVIDNFITKYQILKVSNLSNDIPIFTEWMKQMNSEGKYLKWNVAIAGDKKSTERWIVAGADTGKIERSRKSKYPEYVDIGSLRSGRDILCDIMPSKLSIDDLQKYEDRKKSGKNLIGLRYELGMVDTPLLLMYRIDKNKGKDSTYRSKVGTCEDIIGFSIIISGEDVGSDYVKTVHVKLPE